MLTLALLLSTITPWLLLASVIVLFIGIPRDIFKKKFHWAKLALFFFAGTILLLIIQIVLTYNVTQNIIHDSSLPSSPSNKEQSNWKTYHNGNMSFNYPNDYVIGGTKDVLYVGHTGEPNGSCVPGAIV